MTDVFNALSQFFSGFGLPVYLENAIPEDAKLPYLSWSPVQTTWDSSSPMIVRLWDRSGNYDRLLKVAEKISNQINDSVVLQIPAGFIHLFRGDPWMQPQPMQNSDIKVIYINIGISTMIP